ncbi:Uma2 family endonuclease [Aetokthonos hydrillicola Thurmond2011]|jgi:Uma2 family endonuclease|uniref:Uma2 family endonuclease n=1 Tax=Aetokthonos hydrillicola Thurmond2011 TaxID=2712845 RepID=A0AAP5IB46_9CYAN|nr:Uma2 family endonuclease [Aetokthonos hydrillicola]MBO3463831.1 Uma2 family endonuclease [Aetokthonos hydrillicola CCALA 1050]MBW4588921.1 Uma2 family endonuclease [Aetokthonos hydrillicola CCALA 1050]MDR9898253.1 Uma2 family endonuclease [Aetokthonos hydrillicola Thurmond2011]
MFDQLFINDGDDFYIPDANLLVTEDDTPVDNFASAKQQRLLVASLYSSLQEQAFIAEANVGIYYTDLQPPIVPDVLLSFDVQVPQNWWEKQNRCYMVWKFGKPPEVVIEIVSNKEGDELEKKLRIYEHMRVSYYIVYDSQQQLKDQVLHIYEQRGRRYFETKETWLEQVGLGLTLWEGEFEGRQDTWLRWCYQDGNVLLTGDERASQAEQRANEAEQKAELLAQKLREMGIDPNDL